MRSFKEVNNQQQGSADNNTTYSHAVQQTKEEPMEFRAGSTSPTIPEISEFVQINTKVISKELADKLGIPYNSYLGFEKVGDSVTSVVKHNSNNESNETPLTMHNNVVEEKTELITCTPHIASLLSDDMLPSPLQLESYEEQPLIGQSFNPLLPSSNNVVNERDFLYKSTTLPSVHSDSQYYPEDKPSNNPLPDKVSELSVSPHSSLYGLYAVVPKTMASNTVTSMASHVPSKSSKNGSCSILPESTKTTMTTTTLSPTIFQFPRKSNMYAIYSVMPKATKTMTRASLTTTTSSLGSLTPVSSCNPLTTTPPYMTSANTSTTSTISKPTLEQGSETTPQCVRPSNDVNTSIPTVASTTAPTSTITISSLVHPPLSITSLANIPCTESLADKKKSLKQMIFVEFKYIVVTSLGTNRQPLVIPIIKTKPFATTNNIKSPLSAGETEPPLPLDLTTSNSSMTEPSLIPKTGSSIVELSSNNFIVASPTCNGDAIIRSPKPSVNATDSLSPSMEIPPMHEDQPSSHTIENSQVLSIVSLPLNETESLVSTTKDTLEYEIRCASSILNIYPLRKSKSAPSLTRTKLFTSISDSATRRKATSVPSFSMDNLSAYLEKMISKSSTVALSSSEDMKLFLFVPEITPTQNEKLNPPVSKNPPQLSQTRSATITSETESQSSISKLPECRAQSPTSVNETRCDRLIFTSESTSSVDLLQAASSVLAVMTQANLPPPLSETPPTPKTEPAKSAVEINTRHKTSPGPSMVSMQSFPANSKVNTMRKVTSTPSKPKRRLPHPKRKTESSPTDLCKTAVERYDTRLSTCIGQKRTLISVILAQKVKRNSLLRRRNGQKYKIHSYKMTKSSQPEAAVVQPSSTIAPLPPSSLEVKSQQSSPDIPVPSQSLTLPNAQCSPERTTRISETEAEREKIESNATIELVYLIDSESESDIPRAHETANGTSEEAERERVETVVLIDSDSDTDIPECISLRSPVSDDVNDVGDENIDVNVNDHTLPTFIRCNTITYKNNFTECLKCGKIMKSQSHIVSRHMNVHFISIEPVAQLGDGQQQKRSAQKRKAAKALPKNTRKQLKKTCLRYHCPNYFCTTIAKTANALKMHMINCNLCDDLRDLSDHNGEEPEENVDQRRPKKTKKVYINTSEIYRFLKCKGICQICLRKFNNVPKFKRHQQQCVYWHKCRIMKLRKRNQKLIM